MYSDLFSLKKKFRIKFIIDVVILLQFNMKLQLLNYYSILSVFLSYFSNIGGLL
jgi:hypothetical protein